MKITKKTLEEQIAKLKEENSTLIAQNQKYAKVINILLSSLGTTLAVYNQMLEMGWEQYLKCLSYKNVEHWTECHKTGIYGTFWLCKIELFKIIDCCRCGKGKEFEYNGEFGEFFKRNEDPDKDPLTAQNAWECIHEPRPNTILPPAFDPI